MIEKRRKEEDEEAEDDEEDVARDPGCCFNESLGLIAIGK